MGSVLTMHRGDDRAFPVTVLDKSGAAISLSGASLVFSARRSVDAVLTPLIVKTTPTQIVIDSDQTTNKGKAVINLVPADTTGLRDTATLWWDLQLTAGGKTETVADGTLEVTADIAGAVAGTLPGFLLSPTDLREHVTTGAPDSALQRLIESNQAAIEDRYGPVGSRTVVRIGARFGRYLYLTPSAQSISDIRELYTDFLADQYVILSANDYQMLGGGSIVERLLTGDHPADHWETRVQITYLPLEATGRYRVGLIHLCALDLNTKPGLAAFRVGAHQEMFNAKGHSYASEREDILASMASSGSVLA